MADDAKQLADRLLDAQVDFLLGQLSAERIGEVVVRDVTDVLAALDGVAVADLVDREDVKAVAYKIIGKPGGSELVRQMAVGISAATYQLAANEEHHLGDVVDREHVQVLVRQVLGMRTLHEQVLTRLAESPMVATVASWFVSKLVSDVMQQNRERAEKVPGVSSLLSLGDRAAERVRGATSRHVDQFLGDMAGKGAQLALRRVNAAINHTMTEAPLEDAVMEVWDLHADEVVGDLRDYLTQDELAELTAIGFDIWTDLRDTEYFRELLGAGIDVFFDSYGSYPVPELLAALHLTPDDIAEDLLRFLPGIVAALQADGGLAALIRSRLEPFFHSDDVLALLTRT